MAQEFLDGPDVRSPLKEGSCKAVPTMPLAA